jgi:hypothetical protein
MPLKTHGAHLLERKLLHEHRLRPAMRRTLNRLHEHLAAQPMEAVRELLIARIARKELICQRLEQYALSQPDFEGSRWLVALWNSLRRDSELLYALPDPARREVRLDDYIRARTAQPVAAASEDAEVEVEDAPTEDQSA